MILTGPLGCRTRVERAPGSFVDCGSHYLPDGDRIRRTVPIINGTVQQVQILGETHTCACQKVTLKTGMLAPGQQMPLSIEIAFSPDADDRTVPINVRTDLATWPTWVYEFRWRSYPEVRFHDTTFNFGQVSPMPGAENPVLEKSVDVYWPPGRQPIEIRTVRAPSFLNCEFTNGHDPRAFDDGFAAARSHIRCSLKRDRLAECTGSDSLAVEFMHGRKCVLNVACRVAGPIEPIPTSFFVSL